MESSREKSQEQATSCGFLPPEPAVHVRLFRLADLDSIMNIERASFPSPWSYRFFMEELNAPCSHSRVAHIGESVVGYIVYWTLPNELDIHNVAVEPSRRRRGIGRLLLQSVIDDAEGGRFDRVTLEVRKSNRPAQILYQRMGFAIKGVRKGYYSDNREDALIMALDLKPSPPV